MGHITLNDGNRMPMVGFGTWNVRGESGLRIIMDALDVGYRLIDTARMYGKEEIVGEALRRSGIRRDEVFITTKLDSPCAGYGKTKDAISDSLRRLGTDRVDLLLIHEPYPDSAGMYRAMEEVVSEGTVGSIGVSNFTIEPIDRLLQNAGIAPAVDQVESHVYRPQLELKDGLSRRGITMQSWGPFTEGARDIFSEPVLVRIAEDHGRTSAQVALRYLVQNGIPVIPKSSKRGRMEENLDILDFSLSDAEMAAVEKLDGGVSMFGWND